MNERGDYLVTYKFVNVTREEVERVVGDVFEEMGMIPLKVEKAKKSDTFAKESSNHNENGKQGQA